jgi:YidC/Oxa1 family membrane protein insertase
MDRRTLLALVLMAIVIVATPMLFPSKRGPAPTTAADSASITPASPALGVPTAESLRAAPTPTVSAAAPATAKPTAPAGPTGSATTTAAVPRVARAESVTVTGPRTQTVIVNPGAAPAFVKVSGYRNLRPGARDTTMFVSQTKGQLLHYRLALGADTIALDSIPFTVSTTGNTTTFTSASPAITLSYQTTDDFRTAVRGTVANAPAGTALIIDLPNDLMSAEADTLDDQRHLAYGYKIPLRDPTSIPFGKLDVNEVRVDTGSFPWVNARNKYWLVALMQPPAPRGSTVKPTGIFRGMTLRGGTHVGRVAPVGFATTSYPITNGQIAFDFYAGPQKWDDLQKFGNDLENVNPYAGFLHGVVQPFATIVMKVLLWMKATLRVNYGWVLVIFGIVIRLALWPLNQKAMRTSIQMQRLQPELQDLQKRYKNEPEKQRDALVKLYASHGMSPLSPMLGCLPMLIPMPILFALYHVFQNTVEFRGVSFLWLPDISLKDPYYIIPLVMGASMFVLSWIGMKNSPPNPQAKMMSYMMPVMFTVMFLNFASGLNLYYAVQNIAALPQQLMLTRERAKAGVGTAPAKQKGRG